MRLLLWLVTLVTLLQASSLVLPENFQAQFEQKITNTKKKVIHYSGKVYFSNHNVLKWAYHKPTQKEVCTDGRELMVVDHDLEQISYYRINQGFDFSKILQKAKHYRKNVYVATYQNKQYTIQVDTKGKLQSVAYFDDLENKVQIVFKKVTYGKGKLSPALLQCKKPKNYDSIRG